MKPSGVRKPRYMRAAITMFGTIVGAGIFGLPKAVADAGYAIGLFWMVLLAAAVVLIHLLYGEVVLNTKEDHRLVGYVRTYLGRFAGAVENVASLLGLVGGCLAYLILAGLFLQQVLGPVLNVSPVLGAMILVFFGFLAAVGGSKFIAGVDAWMAWALLAAFLILIIRVAPSVNVANLAGADFSRFFWPYGLVLFSFGGLAAINEVRDMTGGDRRGMRRAIVIGTLMAAVLTILFTTVVVGVMGHGTTSESLAGLNARFGGPVPLLAALAGFLAVFTSYVVFTDYLKSQFRRDYRWPEWLSVILAVGLPLGLFLAGIRDFGRVIGLIGSVLAGLEGIFVILIYRIVKKKFPDRVWRVPAWPLWILVAVYAAGAVYGLVTGK